MAKQNYTVELADLISSLESVLRAIRIKRRDIDENTPQHVKDTYAQINEQVNQLIGCVGCSIGKIDQVLSQGL